MASSVIFGVMMLVCAVTAANTLRMRREVGCACTFDYNPVCGTDGNTYPNECALNCEGNVEVASEGECPITKKKRSAPCPCPANIDPVCGTNGETYDNQCIMICAGVDLDVVGACQGPRTKRSCICSNEYSPACGTDGETYSNKCSLECSGAEFSHMGQC